MKPPILILAASLCWAQCPSVDSNGICILPISAIQNSLLGPLIPIGASPWAYSDLAEVGTAQNMAPIALAAAPALGTALSGTVSHVAGSNTLTTTADLTGPLAGKVWVIAAWNSIDGAATGRLLCPINFVTSSSIVCAENENEPSFSGITAYLPAPPDIHGNDFTSWTTENPSTGWNYYDVAIGLYRLFYRTATTIWQTDARAYADITWQWNLDHGYRFIAPRAASMISQFFRAGDGHPERLPGLYNWINLEIPFFAATTTCPACDNREGGYMLWDIALGAKVDTDPTRHAQYCTWLGTYATQWNAAQAADGSWPEKPSNVLFFAGAPKSFTPPFLYGGAPWREAINVKAAEAAYESLNDTTSQGCNNPTLAAATLTVITNAVTWQNNYGRSTVNRGIFYEVNSQSNDQLTVTDGGTASVSLTSTALVGTGTSWQSDGFCDGTHFIGLAAVNNVYKIASCADDTHATLSVAFGLYGEVANLVASAISFAPAASTSCGGSLAAYCYTGAASGDRNLTRTVPGGIGWLYGKTLNTTYKSWADEFVSSNLGGPTAGLTNAVDLGQFILPCSGPACDGFITDTPAGAANCNDTSPPNTPPCLFGVNVYASQGKNFGEAWGAPGLDNELAWRLLGTVPALTCSPKTGLTPPNVLDIQYQTNMALHIIACSNDIASDSCGATSVQRVINAALGGACVTGP